MKINITSTSVEKGFDAAKTFLDKLIMPAIEETGLLLKDQVTFWKFKNQIRILNKAKEYCEANNISPKQISLKLLCPLLDYSGIEEDEVLQDKWAILLANMVDSEQNIQNHVFPYILSQLSKNEFLILESNFDNNHSRINLLTHKLKEYQNTKKNKETCFKEQVEELDNKLKEYKTVSSQMTTDAYSILLKAKVDTENLLKSHLEQEWKLKYAISVQDDIPVESLKKFELSNLIRLGLVKEDKEFYTTPETLEIPNPDYFKDSSSHTRILLDIEIKSDTNYSLTELGDRFIGACKIKSDF